MTALFLTLEEALALHSDQIARYGGIHGVRDLGLCNKRIGLAAALVFLELHGLQVEASDDELTDLVFGVAEGRVTKAEVATYLETHFAP